MLAFALGLPRAKPPFVTSTPRILSSYLRTSNYSSAHLTRMNDIVKVSSSARGSARAARETAASVRLKKKTKENEKRLWNVHQVRTSPRRYSVGPNRHDVRSSAQQLSHESTCSTRLHQDLTARRVAPRSRAFVSAGFGCAFFLLCKIVKRRRKNEKTKDARADALRVPGRETCLSRLNVVNTEFQLRHLIIWSSIFIHVTSESGDARVRTGLRERLRERLGVRTFSLRRGRRVRRDADPPSRRVVGTAHYPSSSKTRESFRVTSEQRLCVFVAGRKRRDGRQKIVGRSSEDRNRGDVAAAPRVDREKKKQSVGGWRTSS